MKKGLTFGQKILFSSMLAGVFLFLVIMALTFTLFDTNKELEAENADLQAQYDTLVEYVENEPMYRAQTKENNDADREILECFIPGIRKTSILHDYEGNLKTYKLESSSLTLNANEVYAEFNIDDDNFKLQITPIMISYKASQKEFFRFISDIRKLDNNVAINNVSISYDEEEKTLSGSLDMAQYSVERNTKEYVEPEINIKVGEKSIFK